MKILLGGVPFGCDNIGDEAILAAVVQMLKARIPEVAITAATADKSTAALLGVEVVPPFGFAGYGLDGFEAAVMKHDAYIWCGATGLSDYPDMSLDLLETAQRHGIPTYIWGVGMDDELNPVFYKAQGRKRTILNVFGLLNTYEKWLVKRLARRIAAILPKCKGVWLRDPESAAMLASMGFAAGGITADTAAFLHGGQNSPVPPTDTSTPRLGICISTQRQIADIHGFLDMISKLRSNGCTVVGIPMNPKTDKALMSSLGIDCITGTSPDDVMRAAATCNLVLSSRLHLLILAANAGTQGLGIARGSKLDNWLANFGMHTEGSVYDCNWKKLTAKILSMLKNPDNSWPETRAKAYSRLANRFEIACNEFIHRLQHDNPPNAK